MFKHSTNKSVLVRSVAIAWAIGLSASAVAQTAPTPSAPPPNCNAPEYRQFDFWVGEWDVTTPDGKPAGRNVITRALNGCVVHEHWSGVGGMKGESFNIWHRDDKKWHQIWVNDRGNLLRLDGGFQNGTMQMTGASGPAGQPVTNRITWSPSADGTVRQLWEVSPDGGKTWKTAFDGRYRRVK
jgi:hypothetical protein